MIHPRPGERITPDDLHPGVFMWLAHKNGFIPYFTTLAEAPFETALIYDWMAWSCLNLDTEMTPGDRAVAALEEYAYQMTGNR